MNVSKRKSKTDLAAPRKAALAPAEPPTEPKPAEPDSAAVAVTAADATPNGTQEVSRAPGCDDGLSPPDTPCASVDLGLAPAAPVAQPVPDALRPLEQRVRRLEDALAQLQEQHGIETRFRLRPGGPQPPTPPPAAPAPPISTAVLLDVGKRLLGAGADAVRQAPAPPSGAPPPSAPASSLWLFWDTLAEARAIVRMFVDPRYHLRWSARVLPLVVLAAILTSYYWVPGTTIPLLGSWINKAVDLILAFLLFKWLGHEARRYRQTSPDLPPTLRL